MVATGDVRSFPQRVRVTSTGTTEWDGWTVAARYPASLLQSGAGRYAFLVRGVVGEVFEIAGTPQNATVQIAIATAAASGGGFDVIARSHTVKVAGTFASPPFEEGIPFGLIAVFDSTTRFPQMVIDPDLGTSWPARDLLILARTNVAGDPPGTEVHFTLSDLWVMHWDLQRVPLTHLALRDIAPVSPIVFSEHMSTVATVNLPATGGQETWLYFHWIKYLPRTASNAARFAVSMQEDGGPELPMIGGHRMGHARRGAFDGQTDLGILAFRPVVRQPGAGLTLRLSAGGGLASTPAIHSLFRWRVLGVRLEDGVSCSYPATFTEDIETNLAQPPGNSPVWLWERSGADRLANLVVLAQASVAWSRPQTSNHDIFLTDEDRTPYRLPTLYPIASGSLGEGAQSLVVSRRIRSLQDFRWRLYMWCRPASAALPSADVVDLAMAEWTFENAPSNQPQLGPQPPAPLQLVPAREALAANYLPVPPHDIYDANGWTEEPVDNQRRFESDSGLMRTWPVFIGIKSVWTFTRTGLTRAHREDLLAFFKPNTNFRCRLPRRRQDTACKVIERPRFEDVGGVYTMSLRVVELIHIGGMP